MSHKSGMLPPIGISGGVNQYSAFSESPTIATDPDGTFAFIPVVVAGVLGAANVVVWTEVYKVNFGHHYADTISGTTITFRGRHYFRLSQAAREIIDAHEKIHTRQSYWDSTCKKERAAYVVQYLSAMSLLRCYHPNTREYRDLSRLQLDAWLYLSNEGGYTPAQLHGMAKRAKSRFGKGEHSNGPP